ncbi:hypothetical protein [Streptomyces sp. NPDC058240]|uniref:hypothetical protein n=1 Tax=Streptomyces sp. NPDC058240 TaxID=3346396 RepID=UPI0036E0A5D0
MADRGGVGDDELLAAPAHDKLPCHGRTEAFMQRVNEAGAVLDAAHDALQRHGQLAFRLAQDDVGERVGPAVGLLSVVPHPRLFLCVRGLWPHGRGRVLVTAVR